MRPKRRTPRMKTVPGISCSIYLPKMGQTESVMIHSVAVGGMSFIVNGPHFEIGDPIVAQITLSKDQKIIACGKVVNQDFYNPSDSDDAAVANDPRKHFHRYSVKFDQDIDDQAFIYFMSNPARPLDR